MEDVDCKFSKFGFCKYKDTCRNRHFSQICDDLSECMNIKNCKKRHPKKCKRFAASSACKFKDDCAYHHKEITNKEDQEIKSKVIVLEKIVTEMALQIINLKTEVSEMKKEKLLKENNDEEVYQTSSVDGEIKKIVKENNDPEGMVKEVKANLESNDIDTSDKKEEFLKCKLCDYKCKKETLLKKHFKSKHQEYRCKVCDMKVANSMDLLQHTAKEHSKPDEAQTRDIILQDHKKAMKESEVNKDIGDNEFRCFKCERVVSNNDTFDKHVGNDHKKTCKHCAILQK